MSPADVKAASLKSTKLVGKQFEETFKPKKTDNIKNIETVKGKKKKSVVKRLVIILVILIVLIGGAGAALYFSGNLDAVFTAIGLPPLFDTGAITIEEQQAALDAREAALNAREKELSSQQETLAAQRQALDDDIAAAEASANANRTFEEIRAGYSEEKLTELKQVGSIYSKMDAEAAAAIITEMYDNRQIAVIIYYMQPAASALVMANLDPELAADVTEILAS